MTCSQCHKSVFAIDIANKMYVIRDFLKIANAEDARKPCIYQARYVLARALSTDYTGDGLYENSHIFFDV